MPKEKKNFLDGEVAIHVSGFGIYPDIYELEQAAAGVNGLAFEFQIKIFTKDWVDPPSLNSTALLCIFQVLRVL